MNNLLRKILIITAIAIFSAGFLASIAQAQVPPLVVEFEGGSPLFNKTNFTPGDSITKWIKVTNTSGLTQRIAIEAINFAKPVLETDLSRTLMIVIKQGATEIYGGAGNEKTLYQFYQNGETYLSELTNNNTVQYDITISFPADRGNAWQEKTTGFDVVVGFEGTEGGLSLPLPGGSASVYGGGGNGPPGGLPPGLTILNEAAVETTTISVTITWQTSYPATSQVIYALEGEKHTLNLNDNAGNPPKYGYERTTPEYDSFSKVLNHSVTIDGLMSGTKYYFRAVSHGSLAVSTEHSFTTLTPEEAIAKAAEATAGEVTSGTAGAGAAEQPQAPEGGNIQGEAGTTTETGEKAASTGLAASILGLSGSWIFWIILFLIFLIILFLVKRRKKENN